MKGRDIYRAITGVDLPPQPFTTENVEALKEVLPFVKPVYFDREPPNVITAEQVRLNRELTADACQHGGAICCEAKRLRWLIEQAIKHPGASSSLRAALEAGLEPWPASPTP